MRELCKAFKSVAKDFHAQYEVVDFSDFVSARCRRVEEQIWKRFCDIFDWRAVRARWGLGIVSCQLTSVACVCQKNNSICNLRWLPHSQRDDRIEVRSVPLAPCSSIGVQNSKSRWFVELRPNWYPRHRCRSSEYCEKFWLYRFPLFTGAARGAHQHPIKLLWDSGRRSIEN